MIAQKLCVIVHGCFLCDDWLSGSLCYPTCVKDHWSGILVRIFLFTCAFLVDPNASAASFKIFRAVSRCDHATMMRNSGARKAPINQPSRRRNLSQLDPSLLGRFRCMQLQTHSDSVMMHVDRMENVPRIPGSACHLIVPFAPVMLAMAAIWRRGADDNAHPVSRSAKRSKTPQRRTLHDHIDKRLSLVRHGSTRRL